MTNAFEARLERLERANARLKASLLVVAGAAIAVAALWSRGAQAQPPPGDLDVKRLTLRDSEGRKRALLTSANDDSPVLAFYDAAGKTRAVMTLDAKTGVPTFELATEEEKAGLTLAVNKDGEPVIVMKEKRRRSEVALSAVDSEAGLVISGRDKRRIALVYSQKNGAVLALKDQNERPRVAAVVDEEGNAQMGIDDAEGKPVWKKP